ncbi:MFS transporter [Pseudonocardia sp. TRM90224]|uniref:MFS transporter n=1 Tax=Pseudonocardia sp. TRM90224 TaxID=2812678 RepID=UPI001E3DC3B2|nr:MFS transporter [Pseudonocardia sp. TRM90224]
MSTTTSARPTSAAALVALSASAFVMGTAEFVIAGLLPSVAIDLGVSIPAAGLLISGYALAIVIGGPIFVAAGTRTPRRALLLTAAVVFVIGNLVAALASNYPALMVGRVLGALGQGAFLPIASVVAAELVAPERRARAIAIVFAGGTTANIVGTPLGTLLGQQLGWRSTFWVLAALAAVSLVIVSRAVPALPPPPVAATLRAELAAFGRVQVWLTLAIGLAGFGGLFAMFTYVTPLLISVAGFPDAAIAPLLALFGVGLLAGNVIGGRLGSRAQLGSLGGSLAVLAAGLAVLAAGASNPVVAVVALAVVGAAAFAIVAPFMTRLIDQAAGAPSLAAAAGGSAVNLGAALGAYAGGLSITSGLGFAGPSAVGACVAAAGLVVVAAARRQHAR